VVIALNGSKRTATVSVFKGKVLINIREYYEVRYLARLEMPCKVLALIVRVPCPTSKTSRCRCGQQLLAMESQPLNSPHEPARRKTERCFLARRRDAQHAAFKWSESCQMICGLVPYPRCVRGAQGISLTTEQFEALVTAAADISAAADAKDRSYCGQLGSKCA